MRNRHISLTIIRARIIVVCILIGLYTVALVIVLTSREKAPPISKDDDLLTPGFNPAAVVVIKVNRTVEWVEDLSGGKEPVCRGANQPFILAVVPSAVQNFRERHRVRTTWANETLYLHTSLRAIFVLGATTNATLQQQVSEEMARHQDIIQNTFIDTYRNLTYKSISWLSWVNNSCPDASYILKVDDDVVVNPFNLRHALSIRMDRENRQPQTIYGMLRRRVRPHREGKWHVKREEFPRRFYPSFVLGPAYIIGRGAIAKLLEQVPYTHFMWLEDVYTTGLLAERAAVSRKAEEKLYITEKTKKKYPEVAAFYLDLDEEQMKATWQGILRDSTCCKHMAEG